MQFPERADCGRSCNRNNRYSLNFFRLQRNLFGRGHKRHFHIPALDGRKPHILQMYGYKHSTQSHLNTHCHCHRNQHCGSGSGMGSEFYNSKLFIHKKRAGNGDAPVQYISPLPLTSSCTAISRPLSFCYLQKKYMNINNSMPLECAEQIRRPSQQNPIPDSGT